jgi:hypothetical protein
MRLDTSGVHCRLLTLLLLLLPPLLLLLLLPPLLLLLLLLLLAQVHELQALRQQLEDQVEIPQLQPLRDETERLEQLLDAVVQLQVGPWSCCLHLLV